ncbi:hypothetical protein L3X13_13015 [Pseudomonas stutzeri]|nr:hypothetical protein [Stutzerimonas stutzeri]MCF6782580.1 hypothetical protein [Stutzerimonas stutzeri]MCF6805685.1 hypothetical protein [Stutzerimonas stutzeri]
MLLFLYLVGGVLLAHGSGDLLQAELSQPLGGHLAGEAGNGGGLTGVALVGGLQAFGGQLRAVLGGGDALLLRPDQQAERGDQGEAVEELPGGGHSCSSSKVMTQTSMQT